MIPVHYLRWHCLLLSFRWDRCRVEGLCSRFHERVILSIPPACYAGLLCGFVYCVHGEVPWLGTSNGRSSGERRSAPDMYSDNGSPEPPTSCTSRSSLSAVYAILSCSRCVRGLHNQRAVGCPFHRAIFCISVTFLWPLIALSIKFFIFFAVFAKICISLLHIYDFFCNFVASNWVRECFYWHFFDIIPWLTND